MGNQLSTKCRIVEATRDTVLALAEEQEFCCPLQITTSASEEPLTCAVKLRHDFTYIPHSTRKETGFNDWTHSQLLLFGRAVSKEQLADTLERAHCGALNPSCYMRGTQRRRYSTWRARAGRECCIGILNHSLIKIEMVSVQKLCGSCYSGLLDQFAQYECL